MFTPSQWLTTHQDTLVYNIDELQSHLITSNAYPLVYEVVNYLLHTHTQPEFIVPTPDIVRVLLTFVVFPEANEHENLSNKCFELFKGWLYITGAMVHHEDEEGLARQKRLIQVISDVLGDFLSSGLKLHTGKVDIINFMKVQLSPRQTDPECVEVEDSEDDDVIVPPPDILTQINQFRARELQPRPVIKENDKLERAPVKLNERAKRKQHESDVGKSWYDLKIEFAGVTVSVITTRLSQSINGYTFWDLVWWWGYTTNKCSRMQGYGHAYAETSWSFGYLRGYGRLIDFVVCFLLQNHNPSLLRNLLHQLAPRASQYVERAMEMAFKGLVPSSYDVRPKAPYDINNKRTDSDSDFDTAYTSLRPQLWTADLESVPIRIRILVLFSTCSEIRHEQLANAIAKQLMGCSVEVFGEFFWSVDEHDTQCPKNTFNGLFKLVATKVLVETGLDITLAVVSEKVLMGLICEDDVIEVKSEHIGGLEKRMHVLRWLVELYKPVDVAALLEADKLVADGGPLYSELAGIVIR